jgi:monoterpene epsilon-lactone hydrolase
MASIQNFFIRLFLRTVTKKNQVAKQPVDVTRERIAKLMSMAKLPQHVRFEKAECDGIKAEWNIPDDVQTNGVILYLHGGAYVSCSIETHRPLVARIAKAAKTKALSIEYGLAPEHPFPAGLNDAIKVYSWLLNQGYDHNKIVIVGDSAGGGLTIATALKLRDLNIALPAAAICMSPWLDLTCSHDSGVRLDKKDLMLSAEAGKIFAGFYAGNDLKNPYVSPYYADLKGLPPLLIHVSDSEIVLDENVGFEKKAKAAGVHIQFEIWKDMTHVWHGYAPILPEAIKAIKKIGSYIQERIK